MGNALDHHAGQVVAYVSAAAVTPADHKTDRQPPRCVGVEHQAQAIDQLLGPLGRDQPPCQVALVIGQQIAVRPPKLEEKHLLRGAQGKGDQMDGLERLPERVCWMLRDVPADASQLKIFISASWIGACLGHLLRVPCIALREVSQAVQADQAAPVKGVPLHIGRARQIKGLAIVPNLRAQPRETKLKQLFKVDGHVGALSLNRGKRGDYFIAPEGELTLLIGIQGA